MSQEESNVEEFECSSCGRDLPSPPTVPTTCCGAGMQSRAYTLTDHRANRAKVDRRNFLEPKESPLVVDAGSMGTLNN